MDKLAVESLVTVMRFEQYTDRSPGLLVVWWHVLPFKQKAREHSWCRDPRVLFLWSREGLSLELLGWTCLFGPCFAGNASEKGFAEYRSMML